MDGKKVTHVVPGRSPVRQILDIETNRGDIARPHRSHLAPAAPCQDLIDQLFYQMAGLSPSESSALESRLARML